jgi:hypothetical protein
LLAAAAAVSVAAVVAQFFWAVAEEVETVVEILSHEL